MNTTIVMNNLLTLIQSMALTTSNKEWLADHLYEEVREEKRQNAQQLHANGWPKVRRENMVITPKVANMFQVTEPLHEDFDENRQHYLQTIINCL